MKAVKINHGGGRWRRRHCSHLAGGRPARSVGSSKSSRGSFAGPIGARLCFLEASDPARSVAFSPDGKRLVSGSWDDTLIVWDEFSGEALLRLRGHTDDVSCVAFSPDGKHVASGGDDATLRIWQAETGRLLAVRRHADAVTCLAFSPAADRIVAGSKGALRVWKMP